MSHKKATDNLEGRELQFEKNMEKLCRIDKELQNLVKNYDEGLEYLALTRFESSEISNRITPNSYTVGPAYSIVKDDGNKVKLIRNTYNPEYYIEEEQLKAELGDDTYEEFPSSSNETLESFKRKMTSNSAKKKEDSPEIELKSVKKTDAQKVEDDKEIGEDDIYNRFGAYTIPHRIHGAKRNFDKVLDNILNIVNEIRALHYSS
jgi:hypothetical protein